MAAVVVVLTHATPPITSSLSTPPHKFCLNLALLLLPPKLAQIETPRKKKILQKINKIKLQIK